ncbi:TetR/AcrR family transcriptional regulator [Solimonas terrae]|uniref:Helix-turn-helix transcriptional regulator n=1 Tax=Solimonas terrae TaxID=1396819 RepID=A0A6M2BNZ2_9GAMM|nr:helix-turn-helix transcriptional regulator [Solimonas terrae]
MAAALRVMEREGYSALTIRALAQELGISHSTLYNYVERIEDIEAQALQQLTAQLPLPTATTAPALRAELLSYLQAALRLLMQHPGVLFPPIGTVSWKTLHAIGERWVHALIPYAADEKTTRLAVGALVASVVVQAERVRVYGPTGVAKQLKTLEAQGLASLEDILDSMMDLVLPALRPSTENKPGHTKDKP